ncbi:MAG: helix-turn-helix domain-containing protein [Deltaproteobacteria bacterium]|nr:helix-turn-helix domain-containing protein [Deltaproteobacteria bacterium]
MMHNDAGTLSFGPYLKAIREQQDIPLSAVASEIRVGLWQLTLIEAEDHDKLPDTVYVKGILKAYAACIGVDTDDILERYTVNRRAYENTLVPGNKKPGPGGDKIVRTIAIVCLLLAGAAMSARVIYITVLKTGQMKTPGKPPALPASYANTDGTAATLIPDTDKPDVKTTSLNLCMDAVSETTINIQIDGVSNKRLHLYPKDHVELEGTSSFNILIGDSASVNLTLNGKRVSFDKIPGRSINLVLTKKGQKADD